MRISTVFIALCLAACATKQTVTIDPALQGDLESLKTRDEQHIQQEQALKDKEEQKKADAFLAGKKIEVQALALKARPVSDKAAITAAVGAYQKTGEIDPIISETNKISFPFGLSQPKIACSKLRVCGVALQPGEQVLDIVTGDSQRWNISVARSGSDTGERPHIMVKPLAEGELETNLMVTTDRRVYNIDMVSVSEGQYTPQIDFYYPNDPIVIAQPTSKTAGKPAGHTVKEQDISTLVSLEDMNFDYKIKGDNGLAWYPSRVFDDGRKVFIQMPNHLESSEAPVFLVEQEGKQEIVNYRYQAPYYVIDRLFNKGMLILGTDKTQEIVTIAKRKRV
jgi:type IV secretion system protein TrbG